MNRWWILYPGSFLFGAVVVGTVAYLGVSPIIAVGIIFSGVLTPIILALFAAHRR